MAEPEDLRTRLDEAYAAADRLVTEATRQAQERAEPPQRGWDATREAQRDPFAAPELDALRGLIEVGRAALPADLTRQLAGAMRELLLALRALIDFYLERLERRAEPPASVEDIPID